MKTIKIDPLSFIKQDFLEASEETFELLKKALRDPNLGVCHRAVDILIDNFKDRSFDIFIEALTDPNWYVRYEAIWALGEIKDRRAIDKIVKLLSDSERRVYSIAAEVLTEFRWIPVSFDEKLRYYFARSNFGELIKLGDKAFPLLIDALDNVSSEWDLACKAAHALGIIGNIAAVEPLIKALKFDNLRVSVRVVEALGRIGDKRAFVSLMELLNKGDGELDLKVVEALGKIGNKEALKILFSKLNDREPEMRLIAVEALGDIPDNSSIEHLMEVIRKDKNFEIRRRAIRVLGKIKNPLCVPFLIDMGKHEDLCESIVKALEEISDPRSFDFLISTLHSDRPEVRFLSARALGKLGNKNCTPDLLKTLYDEDWRVCGEAIKALGNLKDPSAIEVLKEFLLHKRSYIRKLTVIALGNMGSKAIPDLVSALKDRHNYVRFLAAMSLDKLNWHTDTIVLKGDYYFAKRDYKSLLCLGDEGLAILIKGLGDTYAIVKDSVENFIMSLGEKAEPLLLYAIKSKDSQIRSAVLKLLGELGRGEKIIIDCLKDENSSVRRTASGVLREFPPHSFIMEALLISLQDCNEGVRKTAEKSLRKLKKKDIFIRTISSRVYKEFLPAIDIEEEREYSYEEMSSSENVRSERRQIEGRSVMELCNKKNDTYYPAKYVNIVLYEPKIPPNTGNIARLCAGTGSKLYLVGNLGFSLRDRTLKRAGLDYWHLVNMFYYSSMEELYISYPESRFFYFSSNVIRPYSSVNYRTGDFLIFGTETHGLPANMLQKNEDCALYIPMWGEARSFNLSTSVAIALYEALRQLNNGWL